MNIVEQVDNKETKLQDIDFPYICRICQSRNNLLAFQEQSSVMGTFKLITNIEVSANPDMPQNVCNKCISKLQSIENFIANCIETENMLLRLLPNKQIRIKTEIVEPDEVESMDTCMLELIKNEVQECDVTTDEWNIDPKHMQEFCKNTSQTETECTNENDSTVNIDVSLKDQYLSEACSIKTESIAATYDWENRSSNIDDVKNHNYSDTLNNQEEDKTKVTVKKGNRTRKGYCIYCEAEVHHFVKHLERIHINEPEIELLFSEPPGTIKRKQMILSLRKRGNCIASSVKNENNESDLKIENHNSSETLNIKIPRYTGKTKRASWNADVMKKAILFVANGGSTRDAGRKFGIPESTIRDRKKDYDRGRDITGPQLGRPPIFSQDQEKYLANCVLKMAKLFYGVTRNELRRLAYSYATVNNIPNTFNDTIKMAGKDWCHQFLKRNNEVSLIKPGPTNINTSSAFNEIHITEFFTNLKKLYEKYRFNDNKIFNVDETGICTVQLFGSKEVKQFGTKTFAARRKTVTVICCYNAAGTCYVPPMFIFPGAHMTNSLEKKGPPDAKYTCSKSGWSNEQLFYQWLQHFKNIVKPSMDEPVLIIMDNHSSHLSIKIYEFCNQNGIELLTIPPRTHHRLQPLDIRFFRPLKVAFNQQCDNYLLHFERITLYNVSELFHKAYVEVATKDKAQSGFSASGIWPFQPEKFRSEKFLPSTDHMPAIRVYEEDQQTDVEVQSKLPESDLTTSTVVQANSHLVGYSCLRTVQRRKRQLTSQEKDKSRLEYSAKSKMKSVKRNFFKESESEEEISDSQLYDDNDMDETEADVESTCLICDDSSKKDEYWFQCSVCSKWVHELCSGVDSPEGYVCDFCDSLFA
ncbi:uncharacterized protein [Diabrotica undecimpunctata]|uniref:uncharacterized protein n=1 Tax=Diabrotica undecimpunctata TaxID=50387 RepID=UPI003B63CC2B